MCVCVCECRRQKASSDKGSHFQVRLVILGDCAGHPAIRMRMCVHPLTQSLLLAPALDPVRTRFDADAEPTSPFSQHSQSVSRGACSESPLRSMSRIHFAQGGGAPPSLRNQPSLPAASALRAHDRHATGILCLPGDFLSAVQRHNLLGNAPPLARLFSSDRHRWRFANGSRVESNSRGGDARHTLPLVLCLSVPTVRV